MLYIIIKPKSDENYYEKSKFHKMLIDHIKLMSDPTVGNGFEATNNEVYLYSVASDVELLYIEKSLSEGILKRLRSSNDGELRGVIYEVNVAAAFVRLGYKIYWHTGHSLPEFTAIKNDLNFDVEAKRRDRTSTVNSEYSVKREIRALRQLLKEAQGKRRKNAYLIFMDIDLPPRASIENNQLYSAMSNEMQSSTLENAVIMLTSSGYEHDRSSISKRSSGMIIKKESSVNADLLNDLIESFYADIPEAISTGWRIS